MALPLILEGIGTAANVAGTIGGFFGGSGSEGLSREDQRFLAHHSLQQSLRNEQWSKKMAEDAVQIRVSDAKRAGIHPLAALGINPATGPATTVFPMGQQMSDDSSKWRGLSDMGQNLQRAAMATASPAQRQAEALALKNQQLQNDLLETQVANARVELMKHAQVPAAPSTSQLMRAGDGSLVRVPSDAFSAANAGNILGNAGWWLENKALPFTGIKNQPDRIVYEGEEYQFYPVANRYYRSPITLNAPIRPYSTDSER